MEKEGKETKNNDMALYKTKAVFAFIVSAFILGIAVIIFCVWANITWWGNHPEYGYKKNLGIVKFERYIRGEFCHFYRWRYCDKESNEFTPIPMTSMRCYEMEDKYCRGSRPF